MGQEAKRIKGKIILKQETEANWAISNYIPDSGETVIYDIDEYHNYKRKKIGDGIRKVKDLPFGGATFDDDVTINGDLIVAGREIETSLENILTPQNTIILREGAEVGLINGEHTGIIAEKYDGENTGMLVFDNTGTAYVGDENDLQPLATRQLSTDRVIPVWDAESSTLKDSCIHFYTDTIEDEGDTEIETTLDFAPDVFDLDAETIFIRAAACELSSDNLLLSGNGIQLSTDGEIDLDTNRLYSNSQAIYLNSKNAEIRAQDTLTAHSWNIVLEGGETGLVINKDQGVAITHVVGQNNKKDYYPVATVSQVNAIKNSLPPITKGTSTNSIVINEGIATGASSIAGGTTDIELIKSVLGSGYASLISKYGNVANMSDTVINLILKAANVDYTVDEFKRMLTISPSKTEGILAIALGASNKSQTAGAISLGFGNISGAKGYYITAINTTNKTITLSTKQDATSMDKGSNWTSGDHLFIVNGDRYFVEVDRVIDGGRTVILKNMPFTSLAELKTVTIPLDATYDITDPNERSVINLDKPESGEVDIGWGAIALGALNTILGSNAFGVGYKNLIAGDFGASFGMENTVGYAALAAGILCEALNKASVALCNQTEAIGEFSFAQNDRTRSEGKGSNSQGYRSKAIGDYSDATGYMTTTVGKYSSSAGESSNRLTDAGVNGGSTVEEILAAWKKMKFSAAKGQSSHVNGKDCLSLADRGYAGGLESVSKHNDSFVHGVKLSTSRDGQVVFGTDNVDNPDALLIVGGDDYPNSNAFEVIKKNGQYSVKVGDTEITEAQLAKLIKFIDSIEEVSE